MANTTQLPSPLTPPTSRPGLDIFRPLRRWLDDFEVKNPRMAHFICWSIPDSCPFERDIILFDHTIFHIPALCKLNPVYNELIGLRFRALTYLADICDEDISLYLS